MDAPKRKNDYGFRRFCVPLFLSLLCCQIGISCESVSRRVTQTPRRYRDVGAVLLEDAAYQNGRVHIPIIFDKDGPTFWNRESASFVQRIDVSHSDTQIRFTVITALEQPPNPVSHEIVVDSNEKLVPGTYSVVYEDPDGTLHDVGEIDIK